MMSNFPLVALEGRKKEKEPEMEKHDSKRKNGYRWVDGISLGMILLLVIAAIALVIGTFLIAEFQLNLNTSGLPSSATNAIGQVFGNAYTGFTLMAVGLFVIAAVAILQVVINGFAGKRGKENV
jgi:membrane-anchored glycerophosphoryl diester phosphodiesterase (GDPDase)